MTSLLSAQRFSNVTIFHSQSLQEGNKNTTTNKTPTVREEHNKSATHKKNYICQNFATSFFPVPVLGLLVFSPLFAESTSWYCYIFAIPKNFAYSDLIINKIQAIHFIFSVALQENVGLCKTGTKQIILI